MDPDFCDELPSPKRLKTLASEVQYPKGNYLLHQFVLDNSEPNHPRSEQYINAVLRSMSGVPTVNDINDVGYTALHLAVLKNNLLMVKKLLSCLENIDVNQRCTRCWQEIYNCNTNRNTALHLAAELGHISIIEELLNKGADINMKNIKGETALHFAAKSGNLDIIKLLVSKGANVNVISRQKNSPLHYAGKSGNIEATVFLIRNGADENAKDRNGCTPICYAALTTSRKRCRRDYEK